MAPSPGEPRSYLAPHRPPGAGAPAAISYLPLRLPIGPQRHTFGPAPPGTRVAIGYIPRCLVTIGRFERATADPLARRWREGNGRRAACWEL